MKPHPVLLTLLLAVLSLHDAAAEAPAPIAFSEIGAKASVAYPARIDPTRGDADWVSTNSVIPGTDGEVYAAELDDSGMSSSASALAVSGSSNLHAGGNFTTAGGVPPDTRHLGHRIPQGCHGVVYQQSKPITPELGTQLDKASEDGEN